MAAVFNVDTSSMPVNKDLAKERATTSFKVSELTNILDGGPEKTKRRKELEKLIFSEPVFRRKDDLYMSKSEQYDLAIQRSVKLIHLHKKHQWSSEDAYIARRTIGGKEAIVLHTDMFIPGIERLGTDEQRAKWLPLALNYRIIGTYAQTELGHGTNIMSLETTATFDDNTDEFVMSTPKITSMKWWPGSLGKTATHAIVLAQLIIRGKQYGLQPFIVPLRSLDDHSLLPGVISGDIGPKMSINFADNGFLILNNVRIPRENMLMRNAIVTRDGSFRAVKGDKSNYSTMMYVRVCITKWATDVLLGAIVSAVRYSAVRRQSTLKPGAEEMQILDYQAQQYKIFPAVAAVYVLFFVSSRLMGDYNRVLPELLRGHKALLAEFHSITCGLKALCAEISTEHLGTMRKALGGHGFMLLSSLPRLYLDALTLVTVEGDNTVLYQQTARYLLKQLARAVTGEPVEGEAAYLAQSFSDIKPIETISDCRNLPLLLKLYQKMALRKISQAGQMLRADIESGMESHIAWNKNMMALVEAAKANTWPYIIESCVEAQKNLARTASPELQAVLQRLFSLFTLYFIEINSGAFLETETLSPNEVEIIRNVQMQLLHEIRPDAVALVDAVDLPDEALDSAIGCYDGNVYERMFDSALNNPMNKTEVHPSYHKYLRGLIKGTDSKL